MINLICVPPSFCTVIREKKRKKKQINLILRDIMHVDFCDRNVVFDENLLCQHIINKIM
jgi:16S rRNA A1518/A1519 N6-dimethyltransferase RsmA/KsgA/DIM1 with predicted DNA glycosylase/AP lyase activity